MWTLASFADSYRAETEDRSLLLPRGETSGYVIAIADGVGGRSGGAAAAQMAIDMVARHGPEIRSEPEQWGALIAYIDGEIADDPAAGETTLILIELTQTAIIGASVGDSEAYFFTASGDAADLTFYQQRKPFVGSGAAWPMSFSFDLPHVPGTLIAATDGLFGYMKLPQIRQIAEANGHAEAGAILIESARGLHSRTLYDDIAIVTGRYQPNTIAPAQRISAPGR